jgi:putative transposase
MERPRFVLRWGTADLAKKALSWDRLRGSLPPTRGIPRQYQVVVKMVGVKHWLWRAVDQDGIVLDVLVRSRRDKGAAKRLLRKLLKRQMRLRAS